MIRLRWKLEVLLLAWVLGSLGCASSKGPLPVLDPVGPISGMPFRPSKTSIPGQIQVYTLALRYNDGGVIYNPNTPYDLFDANGKFIVHVRNATSLSDQVAEVVSVRGGLYFIRAQGPALGPVVIPVLVMPEQMTFVNIQQLGRPAYLKDANADWVRLPGGWPVGRRAAFQEGVPRPEQLSTPPSLAR